MELASHSNFVTFCLGVERICETYALRFPTRQCAATSLGCPVVGPSLHSNCVKLSLASPLQQSMTQETTDDAMLFTSSAAGMCLPHPSHLRAQSQSHTIATFKKLKYVEHSWDNKRTNAHQILIRIERKRQQANRHETQNKQNKK